MINKEDYKHINLEFIYDMADGDDEFVIEIVGNCLEAIGPNLQKLDEAIKQEDTETTKFVAHKLRGSFKFIGCDEAGEIVGQIEDMMKRKEPIANTIPFNEAMGEKYKAIEQELKQFLASVGT